MKQGTVNYVWNKADVIGKGAFSSVYIGRHRGTGQRVAVSVWTMSKCTMEDGRQYIDDVHLLQTFDSPYIVKYFASEKVENSIKSKYAIIMELAEENLRNKLLNEKNRVGLPREDIVVLVDNCANALEYLDVQKVAHRNIKPENILVFHQPRLTFKLGDFGLSRVLSSHDETMDTFLGTFAYMPESMITQKTLGTETSYTKDEFDMWSMACCFFEAATGRRPFLPHEGGIFDIEMNKLLTNRPNDCVCGHFDEAERRYVYQSNLPQQHGSFTEELHVALSKYFQKMFQKDNEFLHIDKFLAVSRELVRLL